MLMQLTRCLRFVGQISLIIAWLLTITSCDSHKPNTAPAKPNVAVIKVATSPIPITKQYIGITQSIASVGIRARVKGFLIKMNFIEGKPVTKDQLLFVIDPKPFQAKLDLAQGNLSKSIAAKEYQEVEYLRMKELVAKGDIAKSRFDQVDARFREAVAQVEIRNAEVREAQINLGYCSMYSPFDGIIGNKYVDVGNLVGGAQNTLLANVVQLNPIYVEFSPSIDDFSQLLKYRANMPFKVEVTLPQDNSLSFHGQVDLINNQADVATSTILMRAVIKNPEKLLLPGIYVNLNLILTSKDEALLVPIKAVMEAQGQRTVYVVNKQGTIEARLLNVTGQYGEQYIVKSGLQVGDLVMINGLQKVKPGEEVTAQITTQ